MSIGVDQAHRSGLGQGAAIVLPLEEPKCLKFSSVWGMDQTAPSTAQMLSHERRNIAAGIFKPCLTLVY